MWVQIDGREGQREKLYSLCPSGYDACCNEADTGAKHSGTETMDTDGKELTTRIGMR